MLDSRSVSRLHALIQRRDAGDFSLVDLGSRNGSFVNDKRVCIPQVLSDQDHLVFGDEKLVFRNPSPSTTVAAPGTDTRTAPTFALHSQMLATIVVVDIRDYTPLARTIPEALLAQAIGTWFLRVGQIAQRLGSWAQRYIGDAVMAVWVHDDPNRVQQDLWSALRAVSEIEAATSEISSILPLPGPLRIGAGINTGSATLGGSEYAAMGDTVNAAFRLEAATKALGRGVLLGQGTYANLGTASGLPFVQHEVELKGYDLPAAAWSTTFDQLRESVRAYAQKARGM
jgi:adenylate cyclase